MAKSMDLHAKEISGEVYFIIGELYTNWNIVASVLLDPNPQNHLQPFRPLFNLI